MKIKCCSCGHFEETSIELFVKIIGGTMPVGGYWAWTAYIFAGTGLAMPIVISIITGGVAILLFKDEIIQWIINKGYKCSKCGATDWSEAKAQEKIDAKKDTIIVAETTRKNAIIAAETTRKNAITAKREAEKKAKEDAKLQQTKNYQFRVANGLCQGGTRSKEENERRRLANIEAKIDRLMQLEKRQKMKRI